MIAETHQANGKSLASLLDGIVPPTSALDIQVHGLQLDSRFVQPRDCFVALQGETEHGLKYLHDAISAGARAVLSDKKSNDSENIDDQTIPLVFIEDLREKLGLISNRLYDYPSSESMIVAITGTNGKTSIASILAVAFKFRFGRAGYIGTLGIGEWPDLKTTTNTTPDILSLQKQFAVWHLDEVHNCALEASSHALAQGRLAGLDLDIGVFTNLSHDHLDYHGNMQAYGASKKSLFKKPIRHAVINLDDDFGRHLFVDIDPEISRWPYAISHAGTQVPNLTTATEISCSLQGIRMRVQCPAGEAWLSSSLIGEFNVSNLLAAVAACAALAWPVDEIIAAIRSVRAIPGRMELINSNASSVNGEAARPTVVVDYAHTPDGLEQALQTLRSMTKGRLICVFGCGGDRDREKRPIMGRLAEALADYVIVTADNPRNESQQDIVNDILAGQAIPENTVIEDDRDRAIALGINSALPEDTVLVAGKGHEDFQIRGQEKIPFSDRDMCISYLNSYHGGTQR
ncbi:MAG: UDP-N-acetylmuramoyl-L-alanyl-D-glutamate--2,6-diaminopimelate ligase [Pseudomonadota bacterium]